jgi:hypothetical protein
VDRFAVGLQIAFGRLCCRRTESKHRWSAMNAPHCEKRSHKTAPAPVKAFHFGRPEYNFTPLAPLYCYLRNISW